MPTDEESLARFRARENECEKPTAERGIWEGKPSDYFSPRDALIAYYLLWSRAANYQRDFLS